mmetsp:Transcript_49877/g.100403  ORF Transcript_49877/g.100403 Transcript_49877/m.100403 type:complete len:232 (+) Transcript_49877:960-1655(+)
MRRRRRRRRFWAMALSPTLADLKQMMPQTQKTMMLTMTWRVYVDFWPWWISRTDANFRKSWLSNPVAVMVMAKPLCSRKSRRARGSHGPSSRGPKLVARPRNGRSRRGPRRGSTLSNPWTSSSGTCSQRRAQAACPRQILCSPSSLQSKRASMRRLWPLPTQKLGLNGSGCGTVPYTWAFRLKSSQAWRRSAFGTTATTTVGSGRTQTTSNFTQRFNGIKRLRLIYEHCGS